MAAGKTGVLVGFTAMEMNAIDRACTVQSCRWVNFVQHFAAKAALQILAKEASNAK